MALQTQAEAEEKTGIQKQKWKSPPKTLFWKGKNPLSKQYYFWHGIDAHERGRALKLIEEKLDTADLKYGVEPKFIAYYIDTNKLVRGQTVEQICPDWMVGRTSTPVNGRLDGPWGD